MSGAQAKLAKGTVARGRTVLTEAGRKGPGDTVELPERDILDLTVAGFLVDETAQEVPEASGPTFERG
jgi:hypothetical protein